jgi:outer membrane murein-binding lipoprotein Lpp
LPYRISLKIEGLMNLLGKLLIVLILIGSIVFMSFSITLYATHTNWRDRANKLELDLKKKTDEFNELQRLKDSMETALQLEIQRQVAVGVAFKEKARQLTDDCEELRDEVAALRTELAAQVAAVQSSHETAERLRARLDGKSKALFDAQNDWVDQSTQLSIKIDEAHSLALQLATYQSTCAQLAKDYADAMEVIRKHGLVPDPALYTRKPPAGIQGTVTEVRPRGVIEISVGSDSGLVRGHQLDVVRDRDGRRSYIGKVEVPATAPDRAVAAVMPEFRRGTVQRGDEITYIEVTELTAH